MKRILLSAFALLMGIFVSQAKPVDVETAKTAGRQFVTCSFTSLRHDPALKLVYTGTSDRGETCFYVFDVDQTGFVIISADDRFRPVVGYSDEGAFETENPSPELLFYLEKIIEARTSAEAVLPVDAEADWMALLSKGERLSRNGGKDAAYICETLWNQDAPYNYFAPAASGGPGGRCYAGCVATAMSQVMKRWNYPATGTGTHGYYSSYGYLSANFGATTYQWDLMPNKLLGSATQEQIEAIATLMYHCGVSVNMAYSPNGSGAFSDDVPEAIKQHFSYSTHAIRRYRDEYSLDQWKNMLKEQFDRGWPVYYSGYRGSSGGHAFVCDGYDDNDLFHFNWGWGGNSDGWFVIDEIDYASWSSAIFNFVPTPVYEYMPKRPDQLTVESLADAEFSAVLSWVNPVETYHGHALETLDQVVVTRNGTVIQVFENPAPGASMTFTDHYLPTLATYSVYAVKSGAAGLRAESDCLLLGPVCDWSIEMTSSSEGWMNGAVSVQDGMGVEVAWLTPSDTVQTTVFGMPSGRVRFVWSQPDSNVSRIGFSIKDGDGNLVTAFEGTSQDLKKGVFYEAFNACDPGAGPEAPQQLKADSRAQDIMLTWEAEAVADQVFFVYRDGLLFDKTSATEYVDFQAADEYHYYEVSSFDGTLESEPSNRVDAQPPTEVNNPTNLRMSVISDAKILLEWDEPASENALAYIVYRRIPGGSFTRVKICTATNCEVTVTSLPADRIELYVIAMDRVTKLMSGYASTQADPSICFVEYNNTIIPQKLVYDAQDNGVLLTWEPAYQARRYAVYRNGTLLDDQLTDPSYFDATAPVNQPCCYVVRGMNDFLVSNPSNEVCVNWATQDVEEQNVLSAALFPNPVTGLLNIKTQGLRHVMVLDVLGQPVFAQETFGEETVLDLSFLSSGFYFVVMRTELGQLTRCITKQ